MLLLGDCNHWLKEIKDNSIDLIVTDPPYGIEFMGKDWDKALVSTETWKECYRVLKQGKLAFVMCSPRQDVLARMIIHLQDAGFRTNYTSIYWTYASGFPKAANVSKLIDKREGATREIIATKQKARSEGQDFAMPTMGAKTKYIDIHETKPATEEAKKMEGAYVGFQPKPAVEVILVVSKGKTLTWLDDCRIPYQSEQSWDRPKGGLSGMHRTNFEQGFRPKDYYNGKNFPTTGDEKGRFPANLLVEDDVLNDGKITKSPNSYIRGSEVINKKYGLGKGSYPVGEYSKNYGDAGSYSGYFSLDAWAKTFPFLIVPKASKSERGEFNKHPTVKALKLMSYLITMGSREGDLVLDPFCGSGTVCIAADNLHRKWLGIERNPEYAEIIKKRLMVPLSQLKLSVYS